MLEKIATSIDNFLDMMKKEEIFDTCILYGEKN